MLTIWRNGGFPMYFILAFGIIALATAFVFAVKPEREREGFVRYMAAATLFSVFSGTVADFAAVAHYVANHDLEGRTMAKLVITGFGESMSPGIIGFPILSLVWLMLAVGKRRLDARFAAS
jgi:hypothetical protein